MKQYTGNSFAHVLSNSLYDLMTSPDFVCSPRGQKINENLNVQLEILNPYKNLFLNDARDLPLKYLANELILYFMGTNKVSDFGKASKFWNQLANNDGTVNSAYGHLIFNKKDAKINNENVSQWEWAKQSLLKDKDSRQAIMHYNRPEHQWDGNKDFVCTVSNQFFIRDNKLFLTTYIRSNDIHFGIQYDIPWFMILMQAMRLELLETYPDLEIGSYTHFAGSLHAYERNFDLLNEMKDKQFGSAEIPQLKENPILNPELENVLNGTYEGDDKFFKWLQENK